MTSETATKQALLARIRDGHNTFSALLRSVRPGDQTRPLGDWSVAEHIAHVAAWEQLALAVLKGDTPHEAMGITAEEWSQDTDGINASLHAKYAGVAFDEARNLWTQVHASLIAAIEASTDEELARPLSSSAEDKVSDLIISNTAEHYEEHAGWIREGLGRS